MSDTMTARWAAGYAGVALLPTSFNQTPNTATTIPGVRLWGIISVVKRETTQTVG